MGSTLTSIAMGGALGSPGRAAENPRLDVALAQRDRGCDDRLAVLALRPFHGHARRIAGRICVDDHCIISLAVAVVYSPYTAEHDLSHSSRHSSRCPRSPLRRCWRFGSVSAPCPRSSLCFRYVFFPIVVATATGLTAVPASLMDLIRSLSASQTQTFIKIRFPTAMPHIFVGLSIAITFAVIGAVIGEFVGSGNGLGYLILVSTPEAPTPARVRSARLADRDEHPAVLRHRFHGAHCRAVGAKKLSAASPTSSQLFSASTPAKTRRRTTHAGYRP